MEIYLKDQIVILDEAHNIEDSSRESASVSLTQEKLNETLEDLNKLSKLKLYLHARHPTPPTHT